jgi:hypothetical protein
MKRNKRGNVAGILSVLTVAGILMMGTLPAHAHVGSPDVYADGSAGPYKLFIVVRPPTVIPGVAEIEARAETPGIDRITIAPAPLTGEAAKHPPVPDTMARPTKDAQYFTGHLWIMATGSWQIRFAVNGDKGPGELSIPLPATAMLTRRMQPGMGLLLAGLGILLVLGMVGIVGAAARDAQLTPGETPPPGSRRRAFIVMAVTFAVLVIGVVEGNQWWKVDAADYANYVYKPLAMSAVVDPGNTLDLKMHDPGWAEARSLDDFVPDHNHLMHLYMIRWPEMDVVFHLHPDQTGTGEFQLALPSLPAGSYHLYADVVHANGFPETLVASLQVPYISGRQLSGDDAEGTAPTVNRGPHDPPPTGNVFRLPDGYQMVWQKPNVLAAKTPVEFTFMLLDADGKPPKDMALYMGMSGHAAFVKTDGSVFAHIHPSGTVSMAALMMANPQDRPSSDAAMKEMPGMNGMNMSSTSLPNTVSFPYGFPSPGEYRIFVQMKHGDVIETGTFDADVPVPF